jgi:DNA polymerase-3 subunit beta
MRIVLKKSETADAIQAVAGIVPQRSTRPILYNLLIKADKDGRLQIAATDLEVAIKWMIPADTGGETGAFLVPARKLSDIMKEAPADEVTLKVDGDKINVSSGKARFSLNAANAADYPEMSEFPGSVMTVNLGDLAAMVEKTGFSVAKDEIRYAINGLYMTAEGKTLELTGTDGHRLANASCKLIKSAPKGFAAITPAKLLEEMPRLYAQFAKTDKGGEEEEKPGKTDLKAEIGVSDSDVFVKIGDVELAGRQLEGTYPKYREVIPKEIKEKVKVDKEQFLAALRRAALVTTEETRSVALAISSGTLKVTARDPEVGAAEEELEIEYTGPKKEIAFDPRYLRDGISRLTEPVVNLEVEDSERAGVVREPGYVYVLMPIRR